MSSTAGDEPTAVDVVIDRVGEPNERVANLEKEAFLESLRQYKHVAPRIGKFNFQKLYQCKIIHMSR